jgi:hypothetical protein
MACQRGTAAQSERGNTQTHPTDEERGVLSSICHLACKRGASAQSAGGSTQTNPTDEELDITSGFTELA